MRSCPATPVGSLLPPPRRPLKVMTKSDLIEEVSRVTEVTRRDAELIVESVLGSIVQALRAGDKVQLRGFGTFRVRQRGGRMGRNPKTGSQVQVHPKRVPYFRPSTGLLELINKPHVSRGGRG